MFSPGTATGLEASKSLPFAVTSTGPVPTPKAAPASRSSYLSRLRINAANDIFVTGYSPFSADRFKPSMSSNTNSKSESNAFVISAWYENVSFGHGVIANLRAIFFKSFDSFIKPVALARHKTSAAYNPSHIGGSGAVVYARSAHDHLVHKDASDVV